MSKSPFTANDRLKDLISSDNSLLHVISRFSIPLGFGEKTVQEVCLDSQIDVGTFLTVANFIGRRPFSYDNATLPSLITYLKEAHSYFLEFMLPTIRRRLIEAIDCTRMDDVMILLLKFFDAYVKEVNAHMEYENCKVFIYVEQLLGGYTSMDYSIADFSRKHNHIDAKLHELKNIIIRYYQQKNNNLLYAVLFDIVNCEHDLKLHCAIEDAIFVPLVEQIERQVEQQGRVVASTAVQQSGDLPASVDELSAREKEIVICIAKGMSNKEIANALCLSVHTVATHRRNISTKLQIHTSVGIAIYAIVNKLLTLSEIRSI